MMKVLSQKLIKLLSFHDDLIEEFIFQPEKKKIKIVLEASWLDEGHGRELGKTILYFSDWQLLKVRRPHKIDARWIHLDSKNIEYPTELLEFEVFESSVCFAGYSKVDWVEWKILHTQMEVEFEENI